MASRKDAYARAGVDHTKIAPFKEIMKGVGRNTATAALHRGADLHTGICHPHGGVFRLGDSPWMCITTEGPGNQPWLSELLYQIDEEQNRKPGRYHIVSGINGVMMAGNDCMAHGTRPTVCTDLVATTTSTWYSTNRAVDLAEGIRQGCRQAGCTVVAGESASMKYIINAKAPVQNGVDLCVTVVGAAQKDEHLITGEQLGHGSVILGFEASGVHANGWTLLLDRIQKLPQGFETIVRGGKSIKDEILVPTRCYVPLVCAMQDAGINIHGILPGTGDGVAKLASDSRDFTYVIREWPQLPPMYAFFEEEIGISFKDILGTFNCRVGYYVFVDRKDVTAALHAGRLVGCTGWELGFVEEGKRGVYFPGSIWLEPKQ
jgi:phosphoribosylformylglycinamidine cyclo-ligase